MKIYRVTFALNKIAGITELEEGHSYSFEGKTYHYEHNGLLIFALVKAESEEEARAEAGIILQTTQSRKQAP